MTPADFAGLVVASVAVQVLAAGLGAALVVLIGVAWYRGRVVPAAVGALPVALVGLVALGSALVSLSAAPSTTSVANAIANRMLLPLFGGPLVMLTLGFSLFEGARHAPRSLRFGLLAGLGALVAAGVVAASGSAVPAVRAFAWVRGALYLFLGLLVTGALSGSREQPTAPAAGGTAALAFAWAVVFGETSQRALIELMMLLQLPRVTPEQAPLFVERALEVVAPVTPYSAAVVAIGVAVGLLSIAAAARAGRLRSGLLALVHLPLLGLVYGLGGVGAEAFVVVGGG